MKIAHLVVLFAAVLPAQDVESAVDWKSLSAKATESVNVNLAGPMLEMASQFLKDSNPDEANVKKLLSNLKGVYVRSLKFDKAGAYSMDDVDKIRKAFQSPQWSRIVDVQSQKEGGDNAGVYLKSDGKQILGMTVIAAQPRELTVVEIKGSIDPEQLKALGGNFGIPKVNLGEKPGKEGVQD